MGDAAEPVRATDALANERTFLAYVRTSLSFIAFGFVVARFALFTREIATVLHLTLHGRAISTTFGTAIAAFGAAIAMFGGYRYAVAHRALAAGRIAPLSPTVAIASAAVVALVGAFVGIELVRLH